jgi:WD40 repeat protein/class 3 adenylate cyclase
LIADIRGYTPFTRERGDAAAALLTKRFADLALNAVEARSGIGTAQQGDSLLAVFESSAQAVRAALELQAACLEESQADPSFALPVGIGIDAGEAVPVGGDYRGVALNTAARLCSHAGAGQVLVTRTVANAVEAMDGEVSLIELGAVSLKGFERPVEVIQAISKPLPARTEPMVTSGENGQLPSELDPFTPLVDREHEMRWLRGTWRQVRRGHGRVVIVSGPHMIGKTRLAAEIANYAHGEGGVIRYSGLGGAATAMALAAIHETLQASTPSLLVLDDVDAAGAPVVEALSRSFDEFSGRPVLVLALLADPAAAPDASAVLERVDERGDGHRALASLDLDGVRGIVQLYVGDTADVPVESMARASGGVPGRVHEVVSDWARSEASRRLAAAGEFLAARRDRHSSDLKFADNVIALKLGRLYSVAGRDVLSGDIAEACPYKGLATFEESDSAYFFGRERLVGELAARTVQIGLLGVVGASGSGKSSVIAAGLLPSLRAGLLPGSEHWTQVAMRPGEHPIAELQATLSMLAPDAADPSLLAALDRMPDDGRLVLVVDQFEETFTMCATEDERFAFVAALTDVSTERPERVAVILSIRGDYYAHAAAYPELAAALVANHVLVGPLTREELRRAIELPARRVGVRLESALVDELVEEVADEPGALPLLSAALVELWQTRQAGWIRMPAYEHTGGVRGAVARLAESSYAQLSDIERLAARRIFLRLTLTGEGEAATRRRVGLDELDLDSDAAAAAVVRRFTQDRLLTAGESTVEVAHEALLREWPRLQGWLEEDEQGRQLRHHLTQASRQWRLGGGEPSELYRGARLSATLDWAAEHGADLNELEREFLSVARQAGERETERQRRTNRRLRSLLTGAAVFLVLALVAGSVALVQRSHARAAAARARTAATVSLANSLGAEAVDQPNLAVALLLAREALNIDPSAETRSDLVWTLLRSPQLTGEFSFPPGVTPDNLVLSPDGKTVAVSLSTGRTVFYNTTTLQQVASAAIPGGVTAVSDNPPLMLATSPSLYGHILLANSRTYRPVRTVSFPAIYPSSYPSGPGDPTFGFANRIVLGLDVFLPSTNQWQSMLAEYDASTGKLLRQVIVQHDQMLFGVFTTNGGLHIVVEDGTRLFVYDGRSLHLLRSIALNGWVFAVSPNGQWAANCDANGNLTLVDLNSGQMKAAGGIGGPVGGDPDFANAMEFSPNGQELFIGTSGGQVVIWDMHSDSVEARLEGNGGPITALAVSRSGTTLFTSSLSGSVLRWDLSSHGGFGVQFKAFSQGDYINVPKGAPFWPETGGGFPQPYFALSPDGDLLAPQTSDGHLVVWDISKWPYRPVLDTRPFASGDAITGISFSPDGRTMLVTGDGGEVWMMTPSGRILRKFAGLSGFDMNPVFSPNGRFVVADDWQCNVQAGCPKLSGLPYPERRLAMWNVSNGRLVHPLLPIPFSANGLSSNQLSFSPDGSLIAVPTGYGVPGQTYIVDVGSWSIIQKLNSGQGGSTTTSVFAPGGHLLATVGSNGLVSFWDTRSWREIGQPVEVSSGAAYSLSFDPTGQLLADGAGDGTVRILDVGNPADVSQFGPPVLPNTSFTAAVDGANPVNTSQFSANGSDLVVVDSTGAAWVYPMRWQQWAADACALAGRNLTPSEWEVFVGASRPYTKVCPGLPLP